MSWISRHRAAAAVVAVVGLGAMSLSACGKASDEQQADVIVGGIKSDDSAGAIIARASESTTSVESGRIRVSYSMSGSGQGETFDATMTGNGAFSDFGRKVDLTVDLSDASGSGFGGTPTSMQMREIVDGTALYIKADGNEVIPGLGSGWTKLDMSDLPGAAGAGGGSGLGITGWTGFLDSLKGAGASVTETGTDTVDGVPVTVYEGTIDPQAALDQASPEDAQDVQGALDQMGGTFDMPFTAWVDADGMVRRLEMRVQADMGPVSLEVVMTIELYDFGAPVTIEAPPADEVNDGLSGMGGLFGPEFGTA
jgi:hypothetical protein